MCIPQPNKGTCLLFPHQSNLIWLFWTSKVRFFKIGCKLRRRAPGIYQLRRSWLQKQQLTNSVAGNQCLNFWSREPTYWRVYNRQVPIFWHSVTNIKVLWDFIKNKMSYSRFFQVNKFFITCSINFDQIITKIQHLNKPDSFFDLNFSEK